MQVEPHNVHFPNTVPDDHVWLGLCGNKGWVGLSRDKEMGWKDIVVRTIMNQRVKAFVCIGKHPHARIAENLVNSMHRMDRLVRKHRDPFIARLYMANEDERRRRKAGNVRMWLTYAAWRDRESQLGR